MAPTEKVAGFGYEHLYECAGCREMKKKSQIKMCAKCQTMGYCSKECQKADWKVHKSLCILRPSRNGTLLMVEKALPKSKDMVLEFTLAVIACLELDQHPERINTHGVGVRCAMPKVKESMAYGVCREHGFFGRTIAGNLIPTADIGSNGERLFEIELAAIIENKNLPPGLEQAAVEARTRAQLTSPSETPQIARILWMTHDGGLMTVYNTSVITKEMVDFLVQARARHTARLDPRQATTLHGSLIQEFNVGSLTIEERRNLMMVK